MAPEFGYRILEDADLPRARNMRTRELIKFLRIPATRIPKIAKRGKQELNKRMDEIHPLAGIADILRAPEHEASSIASANTLPPQIPRNRSEFICLERAV